MHIAQFTSNCEASHTAEATQLFSWTIPALCQECLDLRVNLKRATLFAGIYPTVKQATQHGPGCPNKSHSPIIHFVDGPKK